MFARLPHLFLLLLLCFCLPTVSSAQTLLRNIGVDSLFGLPELGSSDPAHFTPLNDSQFVFQAVTSPLVLGNLVVSDGTRTGTQQIGEVFADGPMVQFKDRVYFSGMSTTEPRIGLWVTDGTEAGTQLVFESGATVDSVPNQPGNFFVLDSVLLFTGLTATHGTELWRTDGTGAGTQLVADIVPGPESGFRGGDPAVIDGLLYFTGFTAATGLEPWRTDGTEAGTFMIADLNPGPPNSGAADYTASGGYIYFTGLEEGSGREVRRMQPGQTTIELIGEGGGSTDSSNPVYFVDADGTLFYVAQAGGADGFELLAYDHVGEPRVLGPLDIFPQILKPFGQGGIVFKAQDDGGRELWTSDGTSAGTRRITDLYPGPDDGVFPNVSAASFHVFRDSLVYFAGADGVAAAGEFVTELFVTDGTAAGTKLVAGQMPGTQGSSPGNFFTFNNRVYYAASDSLVGREPFYLGPEEPTVGIFRPAPARLPLVARLAPNPVRRGETLRLDLQLDRPRQLTATLVDVRGITIRHLPLSGSGLLPGTPTIHWRMPAGLPPGLYFLRLATDEGVATLRLVMTE